MAALRTKGFNAHHFVDLVKRKGDAETDTGREKLQFLTFGSPVLRYILHQVRKYALAKHAKQSSRGQLRRINRSKKDLRIADRSKETVEVWREYSYAFNKTSAYLLINIFNVWNFQIASFYRKPKSLSRYVRNHISFSSGDSDSRPKSSSAVSLADEQQ